MSILEATKTHTFGVVFGLGIAGGGALIAMESATRRGPVVMLPYVIMTVLCTAYLKLAGVPAFRRRFLLSLTSFMTATAIFYVFVATAVARSLFDISLLGHGWRIGVMLGIGMMVSALVAFFSSAPRPPLAVLN